MPLRLESSYPDTFFNSLFPGNQSDRTSMVAFALNDHSQPSLQNDGRVGNACLRMARVQQQPFSGHAEYVCTGRIAHL